MSPIESHDEWLGFLRSVGCNYKLPFHEQVLVHAQRPDATAVLELERWNKRFGRWVNRGSTGIAVFGEPGGPRLRYYFDIADTHASLHARPASLWTARPEHLGSILESLRAS